MKVIPVITPQVLTSDIFLEYGGQTGTATSSQLALAFCIAEQNAQQELCTPLVPTAVTGTFFHFLSYGRPLMLPHTHLRSIDSVVLQCETSWADCSLTDYTKCAVVKRMREGIVELRLKPSSICACGSCPSCGWPLRWKIDYTAGLEAGLATGTPTILMALVVGAQLALDQIIDPGAAEGGPGDPGVQAWGSMSYREQRTLLRRSAFGSSALANYAAGLLQPWKVKRVFGLGR